MHIIITIFMDNAAFEDNPDELRTLLAKVKVDKLTDTIVQTNLLDTNGNVVGDFTTFPD